MPTTESLYKAYRPVYRYTDEPLTRAQYVEAVSEALEAIERGEVFADDEVMRELESDY